MSANTQSPDFTMHVEKLDCGTLVALAGELDIDETPHVIVELRKVVSRDAGPVFLDVRELTYIDSAGLAVLASTRAALQQEGRSIAAVGCHGIFQKTMQITQLDKYVACFPSLDDALEAAKAGSES